MGGPALVGPEAGRPWDLPGDLEGDAADEARTTQLAATAEQLGQLVRHSLLDLVPAPEPAPVLGPAGPSSPGPVYRLHPVIRAAVTGEQASLDAEAIQAAQRSGWDYALACVTQQPADVDRLAREREFLVAMAALAQRAHQDAVVAPLVGALAWYPGLLGRLAEAERLLRWGVAAYQQLGDRTQASCLIDSLGNRYYLRGALAAARAAFEQSVRLTESLDRPPAYAWDALLHLAQLAMREREVETARRLTERYLRHGQEAGDVRTMIWALRHQAEVALLAGDRAEAYQTYTAALELDAWHTPGGGCPFYQNEMRAVLAQLDHDTERARIHTESIAAIAQRWQLPHYAIKLLVAQAAYEQQYGEVAAAVGYVRHAQEIARRLGVPGLGVYRGMVADLLRDRPPSRTVSASRRYAAEAGSAPPASTDEHALAPRCAGGEIPREVTEIPRVRGEIPRVGALSPRSPRRGCVTVPPSP
jgi:tetratricopeptide (TPR) repeat protein